MLARWACALFDYGTISALALSALPESFSRPFAVPTGVALIGLGISLWRETVDAPGDGIGHGAGGPMSTRERSWRLPAALVALSAIPLTAGTLRLIQLAGGPAVIPADHRFAGFPISLVVHILGAATFALVGILQFVPRFRRRHPVWHRRAGRVIARARLLVALSALRLALFYEAQPGTGDLLYVLRLIFGSALAACLALGIAAARRRDIATHRAWMVRGYAIGLAAGTQVFIEGIAEAIFGTSVLAKGAAWIINLAVAEWALRRPARRSLAFSTGPRQAGASS